MTSRKFGAVAVFAVKVIHAMRLFAGPLQASEAIGETTNGGQFHCSWIEHRFHVPSLNLLSEFQVSIVKARIEHQAGH